MHMTRSDFLYKDLRLHSALGEAETEKHQEWEDFFSYLQRLSKCKPKEKQQDRIHLLPR